MKIAWTEQKRRFTRRNEESKRWTRRTNGTFFRCLNKRYKNSTSYDLRLNNFSPFSVRLWKESEYFDGPAIASCYCPRGRTGSGNTQINHLYPSRMGFSIFSLSTTQYLGCIGNFIVTTAIGMKGKNNNNNNKKKRNCSIRDLWKCVLDRFNIFWEFSQAINGSSELYTMHRMSKTDITCMVYADKHVICF